MAALRWLDKLVIGVTDVLDSLWFRAIFMTVFSLKLMVVLALQAVHIRWQKMKDQGDASVAQKLASTTAWLYYISPMVPQLPESALLVYLLFLLYTNPIQQGIIILGDRMDEYYLNLPLLRYLRQSPVGKREINRKLDSILIDMQRSNINYSDFLLSFSLGRRLQPRNHNQGQLDPTTGLLMKSLSREYGQLHLLRLSKQQSAIWPSNRDPQWLNHLCRWYPWALITAIAFFVGTLMSITIFLIKISHDMLEANGVHVERAWPRGFMICELIFSYQYNAPRLVSGLVGIILALVDQLKLLDSVRNSMHQFKLKTTMLRHSLDPRVREELRFECDKCAIEAYVKLRYFVDELQPLLRATTFNMNQFLLPSLIAIGIVLLHSDNVGHRDMFIVSLFSFFILFNINEILIMAAAFRAQWTKIIPMSWSLLYCSLVWPSEVNSTLSRSNLNAEANPNGSMIEDERDDDELAALVNSCHLSPHLRLLWERLMTEEQFVSRKLTCRAFGFYMLDYDSVLKYNVYLFSMLLLYLKFRLK